MRFTIDFKLLGEAPFLIPVNYQSEFSTWIHKMLHFQNKDFKAWLKKNDFVDSSEEYKLYTFSDVFFAPHKVQKDKMVIENNKASMILSFYAPPEIEPYVTSIFREQEFKIGDARGKTTLRIEHIQNIEAPDFGSKKRVQFSCVSPMLIADVSSKNDNYLTPDQKGFDKVFFKSLMFKYANLIKHSSSNASTALTGLNDLQFKLLGKPKTKHVKIKTDTPHQKSVKGYMFDFEVKAPQELIKIGYDAGFGELNHLGFGCCELKA